jgi:hypothetical protein
MQSEYLIPLFIINLVLAIMASMISHINLKYKFYAGFTKLYHGIEDSP